MMLRPTSSTSLLMKRNIQFLLLGSIIYLSQFVWIVKAQSASAYQTQTGETIDPLGTTLRQNHLDRFDPKTVEYYLQNPDLDYDVAILYYASWDKNSQHLAPIWDQIANLIKAGTVKSKMIMGIFDCEASMEHVAICTQTGLTHYPTMQFYALTGGKVLFRSNKEPKHMTQFPGLWYIGDSIYDWIRAMSSLCQLQRWMKNRSWFFGLLGRKSRDNDDSKNWLPTGLPNDMIKDSQGGGDASSASADEVKKLSKLLIRASSMVDSLLFPLDTIIPAISTEDPMTGASSPSDSSSSSYQFDQETLDSFENCLIVEESTNKTYVDMYKWMNTTNAWQVPLEESGGGFMGMEVEKTLPKNDMNLIISCVMAMALDYCSRLSTQVMSKLLASKPIEQILGDDWNEFEMDMNNEIGKEPYCLIIEDCIVNDFISQACRPNTCPFQDQTACRYLSGCLSGDLLDEYAEAMNITSTVSSSQDSTGSGGGTSSTKKSGWGF